MVYSYILKQEGKLIKSGFFSEGKFGEGAIFIYDILRPLLPLEFDLEINKVKQED